MIKIKKYLTVTNFLILFMTLVYFIVTIFSELGVYIEHFGICGTDICPNGMAFYRNFTSLFMHFMILHLIANMVGLYFAGNLNEKYTNKIVFLLSFILIGVFGSMITNALYPILDKSYNLNTVAQVGSSIAVFGIIGMNLGYVLTHKGSMKEIKKSYKIVLAIYGVFFTYFMNSETYWTVLAHNVGFIMGIVLYIIMYYLFFKRKEQNNM